jgi:hypothetical protein
MSEKNDRFKSVLGEWNRINDDIDLLQKAMKEKMKPYETKLQLMKDKSKKLETTLVNYMEHNGLNDKKIIVENKSIECQTSKRSEPVSKDFILKKLGEILDEQKAAKLVEYIYNNRQVTNKLVLKRKEVKKGKK